MALVPRLRPAALVVLARLLLREVGDLLELPGAQPVEEAQLAADVRNDGALAAADERDERREVEVAPDLDLVRHGLAERQCLPDVVEPGAEHRDAVGAVPVELLAEEVLDPLEVLAQPDPLLVGLVTSVGAVRLRALVDEGVDARRCIAGRGRVARMEVEVEADRAALRSSESGELPQRVPGHGAGHGPRFYG